MFMYTYAHICTCIHVCNICTNTPPNICMNTPSNMNTMCNASVNKPFHICRYTI